MGKNVSNLLHNYYRQNPPNKSYLLYACIFWTLDQLYTCPLSASSSTTADEYVTTDLPEQPTTPDTNAASELAVNVMLAAFTVILLTLRITC